MITKVVSGGQNGIDLAALRTAKRYGIHTGGWMPKGWTTLDGPMPHYREAYNMFEHDKEGYKGRTWANVCDSDGTLRIAKNFKSHGEVCTLNAIYNYKKPHFDVYIDFKQIETFKVVEWIYDNNVQVLNVAGNSNKTCSYAYDFGVKFLSEFFEQLGFEK